MFEAPINNGGIFESRQTSSFALAQSAFPPLHGSIPLSLIPQAPTRAHPPSPSPPSANLSVVPLRLSYSSPVPILLPSYSSPSPKIIILQLPWRVTWFPFTEIHMQMSQIPHASRFVSTILDTRNPSYTRFPLTMCANNIIISSPRPCSTPTLLMLIRAHSPHP